MQIELRPNPSEPMRRLPSTVGELERALGMKVGAIEVASRLFKQLDSSAGQQHLLSSQHQEQPSSPIPCIPHAAPRVDTSPSGTGKLAAAFSRRRRRKNKHDKQTEKKAVAFHSGTSVAPLNSRRVHFKDPPNRGDAISLDR